MTDTLATGEDPPYLLGSFDADATSANEEDDSGASSLAMFEGDTSALFPGTGLALMENAGSSRAAAVLTADIRTGIIITVVASFLLVAARPAFGSS